jgi:NTE family protein
VNEPSEHTAVEPESNHALLGGVCLSGGGFRASLYGFGVLRYLAEADLLRSVGAISAVSGGAIAAAFLADRAGTPAQAGWTADAFNAHVTQPFREVVTTQNLRNTWLRRAGTAQLLGSRRGRGVVLGEVLAERLFWTKRVSELPTDIQVILTATDLGTGRAFRMARDFIGSWDFKYVPTPEFLELGMAVAASAAVPALFPPVLMPTAGLGLRGRHGTMRANDGSVM